ncbi:MAG: DUF92 domain-containing protein [Saprospiraceae bacterium]|nr:DUF92 domain-containing protein [Saprospiraceae bacterium]
MHHHDLAVLAALGAGIAALTLLTEAAARAGVVPTWLARKCLHVGAVGACACAPLWVSDLGPVVWLVAAAEPVLLWLVGTGRLMREEGGRRSWGIALFPLAYLALLLAFPHNRLLIALPMGILALADAAAAVAGNLLARRFFALTGDRKSVAGSLAFALVALALLWFFFPQPLTVPGGQTHPWAWLFVLGSLACALACLEALGSGGMDNVYVPVGAALFLAAFQQLYAAWLFALWVAAVPLAILFVVWTTRRKTLSAAGALAAALMGLWVATAAGPRWLLPLFAFFLSSALMGRWASRQKPRAADAKYGRPRDALQVLCNGGPYAAAAGAALWMPAPEPAALAMAAAMAGATADTWSSEFGQAFKGPTIDIARLRPVQPGLSGGISLAGTLAGVAGAVGMALLCSRLTDVFRPLDFWFIALAGVAGMLLDSLLGALLQAKYRPSEGGDRQDAPGPNTLHVSGYSWMTNDAVNLLANTVVTLAAFAFSA